MYFKGNQFYSLKAIRTFQYCIRDVVEKNGKYYVLLDIPNITCIPENGLRNIYCLNEDADILWRVENCKDYYMKKNGFCAKPLCNIPYESISFDEENKLWAGDFIGRNFLINQQTGQIKQVKIVR